MQFSVLGNEANSAETSVDIRPEPWLDWIVTVLLMLGISLPFIMLGATWSRTTLEFENRQTEPWPSWAGWTSQDIRGFTARFESAFNDRFGGRDQLVRLHNLFQAAILKKSPSSRVVIGKQDWLFVRGGWYDAFLGQDPFTRETNEAIARGIERRARLMQEMGITYRLLYSPDKHTIYPEYLDETMRQGAERTRIDDVLEALPADIRSLVIDLRKPLLDAKRTGRVFYVTDSHWNSYGAWVGYAELARSLGLKPGPYPDPSGLTKRTYSGDLARMMGADAYFNETEVLPKFMISANEDSCRQPIFVAPRLEISKYECPTAPIETLVVYRDSFGIGLAPYLSKIARGTTLVANAHHLDIAWLGQMRPTVMVDQIVERGLPVLPLNPAAFRLASFLPRLDAIDTTFTCSVQNIKTDEHAGHPARIVLADGRLPASSWRTRPDAIWLVLRNERMAYAAQAEFNRPELVSYYGAPALDAAVVNLIASGDELPVGAYEVTLVAQFADHFEKCISGSHTRIPT